MKQKRDKEFSQALIKWYELNKRDLPWRDTSDPYAIWISEIILQQTRVAQGMDYYRRIITSFPDIHTLAEASEDHVMKLWQGLGYYSRARNMHFTAKYISSELKGKFPESYEELLKLKGIGEYTAAAIASIVFGKAVPVVDGNVLRVYTRYTGLNKPVDDVSVKKTIRRELLGLIDKKKPALFNQAIMELGALCCTPKNPKCASCPLQNACYARLHDNQQEFPVKNRKKETKKRYFHYLVLIHKGKTFISKRETKDIWKSLYEFPLIETQKDVPDSVLLSSPGFSVILSQGNYTITGQAEYRHILTHQVIHARFYIIQLSRLNRYMTDRYVQVPIKNLYSYAFPRLIEKFLDSHIQE